MTLLTLSVTMGRIFPFIGAALTTSNAGANETQKTIAFVSRNFLVIFWKRERSSASRFVNKAITDKVGFISYIAVFSWNGRVHHPNARVYTFSQEPFYWCRRSFAGWGALCILKTWFSRVRSAKGWTRRWSNISVTEGPFYDKCHLSSIHRRSFFYIRSSATNRMYFW